MKKLMIAAAVACAAVLSYGASANWQGSANTMYDGTGSAATTAKYNGTAYIFDAAGTDQAALYALILDGATSFDSKTAGFMTTGTISNGSLSGANWSNGEIGDGKTYTYYYVVIDDDKVYFSNYKSAKPNSTASAKSIAFGAQYDDEEPATYRPNSTLLPTDGYQGAGQWATVPEPTSGLLLLLGVAGLALKRRRA